MNKSFLMLLAAVASGSVFAADYVDTARVISSTPITERVSEPKQECWNETVSSTGVVSKSVPVEEHSIGGALLGGVIGGVVGSQIGQGNGSTVATGVGAIAGAIIGDRVASQNNASQQSTTQVPQTQTREERHCRQVENFRDVIRGYNVTYRYKGQDISTRMSTQPGDTVRVGVSVLGDANASDARDVHSNENVRGEEGRSEGRRRDNRDRDSRDRRYGEERGDGD